MFFFVIFKFCRNLKMSMFAIQELLKLYEDGSVPLYGVK